MPPQDCPDASLRLSAAFSASEIAWDVNPLQNYNLIVEY